jgi:hypothetical protein
MALIGLRQKHVPRCIPTAGTLWILHFPRPQYSMHFVWMALLEVLLNVLLDIRGG